MKHNLIICYMKFVEKYNVNSIIDVLIHGYGFKCHSFFKKLIMLPLLCQHPPHGHYCFLILFFKQIDLVLSMTVGFFLRLL
jgi:hypothetical protein